MGLATGVGLLYKSFALAVPVGLGLALWYLHARGYRPAQFLAKDLWKIVLILSIALALFGSWFLLDPDPGAVWTEFVLGENAGKFGLPGGYLHRLLWGTSSLWSLALGYPLNAGLLAPSVVALFVSAWKRRGGLADGEKLLWLWALTLLAFFSLPSQRSSRYLLAGMPALAVLLALSWQRIDRRVLVTSLLAMLAVVGAIGYLSVRLQHAMPDPPLLPGRVLGPPRVRRDLRPPCPLRGSADASRRARGDLPLLLSFAAFLAPLDGPPGRYDEAAQRSVRGRTVWVPVDFIAKEEGYRFLLPEADVRGYPEERGVSPVETRCAIPLGRGPGSAARHRRRGMHDPRRAPRAPRPPHATRDRGDPPRECLRASLREGVAGRGLRREPGDPCRRTAGVSLMRGGDHRSIVVLCTVVVAFGAGFHRARAHATAATFSVNPVAEPSIEEPRFRSRFLSTRQGSRAHAASLVELADGSLRAFWYSGSGEGAPDVEVRTSVFDPGREDWDQERVVADAASTERSLARYVRKVGNPTAIRARDGTLWLFYVTVSLGGWSGSSITAITSHDEGKSWNQRGGSSPRPSSTSARSSGARRSCMTTAPSACRPIRSSRAASASFCGWTAMERSSTASG